MKNREIEIAKDFGILEKVEKLESELLNINAVVDVDFDLSGFYDNMKQVIILANYNIPATLQNYYEVRRELLNKIIEVAKDNGLKRTEDRVEDYGEWFYFVFKHDKTWNKVS